MMLAVSGILKRDVSASSEAASISQHEPSPSPSIVLCSVFGLSAALVAGHLMAKAKAAAPLWLFDIMSQ